ncbi:MAG: hypothetical protein ACLUR5_17225 [Eubacterium ventriosum]
MDNRKTSQGFAKFSIKTLVYVVMIVVAIVCAAQRHIVLAHRFSAMKVWIQSREQI